MEKLWIVGLYVVLILESIFFLIYTAGRPIKRNWLILYGIEILSVAACAGHWAYFDRLPGRGMMPGLTWIFEIASSILGLAVFLVIGAVSVGIHFLCVRHRKKEQKESTQGAKE